MEIELKKVETDINANLNAVLGTNSKALKRQLEQRAEKLDARQSDIIAELELLQNTPVNGVISQSEVLKIVESMQRWQGMMDNPNINRDVKRNLVLEVVEKVTVSKEGLFDIDLNFEKCR